MQITKLQLKNFRCFNHFEVYFDKHITIIIGLNGSGKTSIMESLHYSCYLRSFRASTPKDLIAFGHESFFIRVELNNAIESSSNHEIQIGFAGKKKLVKINQKPINSYKELNSYYRVITVMQDDIFLIKGDPESRRIFIDQACILHQNDFIQHLRAFKHVLKNRNALLQSSSIDYHSYAVWTQQLWHHSLIIQKQRINLLEQLQKRINSIINDYFDMPITVFLKYQARKKTTEFENLDIFLAENTMLFDQEKAMGRSLFGAHLDDILISFEGKMSKSFASRGQQKLIVLLLKIAQIMELTNQNNKALFLLDDFMTDFDKKISTKLLSILTSLPLQLIFSTPLENDVIIKSLKEFNPHIINLTH